MKQHENDKVVLAMPAGVTGSSETATLTIDTKGYDHASVTVLRAANANTVFASILKVEESDDNSSYTNVTALVGGGVGGFTIPGATVTTVASAVKMDIDTRSKKRYLKVSCTPTTAVNVAIAARLSRAEVSPTSASEAGVVGWVTG
jgi:hypothetical protein